MKILLQGAEFEEIKYYIEKMKNKKEKTISEYTYYIGNIGKNDVIISKTNIGELNAAISTCIALQNFNIDLIINQGTAGGHDEKAKRGDIIVASSFIYTTSIITKREDESNIKNWEIFNFTDDFKDNKVTDENRLKNVVKKLEKVTNKEIHVGIVASGDIWNREKERIIYMNKHYKTLCEEMELAGVYLASKKYNIPMVAIRIISNNEILDESYKPEIAEELQENIYKMIEDGEI